ncbi:flavodoxin [[Ruminococcus] lactaris]|uniref:flavodoxin n=1 Tax=[Ruminococcus] lactaris TaxID=46228 RepID=UPI001A9B7306
MVAYFSWSGNTQQVANWISDKTGGELFRIIPEVEYTEDDVFDRAQDELNNGTRPPLSSHIDQEVMEQYDVIFVGFPIWWYDLPMPVWSFLEEYDLSGKTIIPFFTHNGSSSGASSISTVAELCPDSTVLTDDYFTYSGNNVDEAESAEDKLSLKERSLITVVALLSQGLTDTSFVHHLESAKANGITKSEIAEIITHAAFYAGWPKAWAAFRLAKDIWKEDANEADEKTAYEKSMLFPIGQPNDTFAQYFVGQSYLAPVSKEQVGIFNVTFEPGCRNNWHIHHAEKGGGQILVCVAGRGFYQEWGKTPICMTAGDVVNIPAGVKHWHGAAPDSWFSHLVVEVPGENTHTEWCEPVSNEDYANIK